jgi:hypothetical protein
VLAALLLDEEGHAPGDPRASVADYRRRLDLARRLRRLRQVSRAIAETPAGPAEMVTEQLRTLDREGREVRASALGAAGGYYPGPQGPQGAQTDE